MLSDAKYQRIKHVSLSPERLKHNGSVAERVFIKLWQEENERELGINSGLALLEVLLDKERTLPGSLRPRIPSDITQRDAEVAASVIQWLGTNCGSTFLYSAEKEIKKRTGKNRRRRDETHHKQDIKWERQRVKTEERALRRKIEREKADQKIKKIRDKNEAKEKRLRQMRRSREERENENPFTFLLVD